MVSENQVGVPRARATMPMVIRRAPPKVDKAAEAAKAAVTLEAAQQASAKAARKEAKRAALKKLQAASTLTQTAVVATDESQQSQQTETLTESQEAMVDRADERLRTLPAIAKVWAHKNHTTGSGGWLEDETIDAAIRWSLLGDTRMGGLAPCPGRNEYFSLETIQALQGLIQNYQEREDLSTTPLLQVALEGLTGINGNLWKEVDGSQLTDGIELDIPAFS